MAVTFEFEVCADFHFAKAFGEHFGIKAINDRVQLPDMLGDGFIQEVYLNNGLYLCVHKYVLKQELILKRKVSAFSVALTMKFDCRRIPAKTNGTITESLFKNPKGCEVEFGTANFFTELTIPANQIILFMVIGTERATIGKLIKSGLEDVPIEQMISSNKYFVFHERMTLDMERALKHLSVIEPTTQLSHLLYDAKTLELIYLLFSKLLSRDTKQTVFVNPEDAAIIYSIRTEILKDFSVTPDLPKLAAQASMSQSKLKQLFSQIFGKSIYNYFQAERMDEAAFLLNQFTVSEVGYKVGFSNLSHFTRLFEKHHSIKPKKYKDSLKQASENDKYAFNFNHNFSP
jgi:AraC-like DNA-binding protein